MNNTFNLLGLAYRARKVIVGLDETIKKINKVSLVIITSELSEQSRDKINKICDNKIEIVNIGKSLDLSHSLGLNSVKVISIIDEGFKEAILKSL